VYAEGYLHVSYFDPEKGGSILLQGTSAALQSKKKSAVTALTMVIDFAPIQII
jgi:hypothetical protein